MENLKLLCAKTQCGLDLPLNTQLSIDGHNMTILGLAKQEDKDGLLWQWWIVEEDE